jgi:S1-C subfamily serine protease
MHRLAASWIQRAFLIVASLALMATWIAPTAAQEPGDQVIAKSAMDLRIGNMEVGNVPAGTVLIVEDVNDDWLWVRSLSGKKGWVQKNEVKLRPTAPPAPRERGASGMKSSPVGVPRGRPFFSGVGTAFVVQSDGHLVTNAHVVRPSHPVFEGKPMVLARYTAR